MGGLFSKNILLPTDGHDLCYYYIFKGKKEKVMIKEYNDLKKIQNVSVLLLQDDRSGLTFMYWVCKHGYYDLLQIILNDINNDPNKLLILNKICEDKPYIITALYAEIHLRIVRLLLENGSDINGRNKDGNNALLWASRTEGDLCYVVRLLLEYGSDINVQNTYSGSTPLMYASSSGHKNIVKVLLEKENKIDINKQNNKGETALMYASSRGHKDIVQLLLSNGSNINAKNTNGENALIYALDRKKVDLDTVELLLSSGLNKNSESAVEYAIKKNHIAIASMIAGWNIVNKSDSV
jgi:ankyrin repeat protein